ncbi:hypothetical protein HDV00_000193 [Rhizophlyctis rosea]|nr:hypothetical protein HDV00_000193 [Rhizophlyctis rosea]
MDAVAPYINTVSAYLAYAKASLPSFPYPIAYVAAAAIVLHVANYNATAQLEHKTRIFTKILGSPAVYFYAVYLILSALLRDHYVMEAVEGDAKSLILLDQPIANLLSKIFIGFGIVLNLWTLQALGIKGMYNGDSFGHLMDAPVTGGPYRFFSDPQYVGTTFSLLGYAVRYQSLTGYVLTLVLYLTFLFSVHFVEGPHMRRIYANKGSSGKGVGAKSPKKPRYGSKTSIHQSHQCIHQFPKRPQFGFDTSNNRTLGDIFRHRQRQHPLPLGPRLFNFDTDTGTLPLGTRPSTTTPPAAFYPWEQDQDATDNDFSTLPLGSRPSTTTPAAALYPWDKTPPTSTSAFYPYGKY